MKHGRGNRFSNWVAIRCFSIFIPLLLGFSFSSVSADPILTIRVRDGSGVHVGTIVHDRGAYFVRFGENRILALTSAQVNQLLLINSFVTENRDRTVLAQRSTIGASQARYTAPAIMITGGQVRVAVHVSFADVRRDESSIRGAPVVGAGSRLSQAAISKAFEVTSWNGMTPSFTGITPAVALPRTEGMNWSNPEHRATQRAVFDFGRHPFYRPGDPRYGREFMTYPVPVFGEIGNYYVIGEPSFFADPSSVPSRESSNTILVPKAALRIASSQAEFNQALQHYEWDMALVAGEVPSAPRRFTLTDFLPWADFGARLLRLAGESQPRNLDEWGHTLMASASQAFAEDDVAAAVGFCARRRFRGH